MFSLAAIASALFGGGFLVNKLFGKPQQKASASSPLVRSSASASTVAKGNSISAQRVDEFLELRSDGLYQFNKDTAIAILGWMGSVSARPAPTTRKDVVVYDLIASEDGMPPAVGMGAGKVLLAEAKSGKTVLVLKDITKVGARNRRAVATTADLHSLAGQGGDYAILIVPASEVVEPALPPMPGFEGAKRPVPGAVELPKKDATGNDASSEMPADLRAMVEDLLKKDDCDARDLENIARQLRLGGYSKSADMIEAKASDIHAKDVVGAVELRTVFVIPKGHSGAMSLAQRLTGDPRRYKELLSVNPELSSTRDGRLRPWVPGQIVKLPAAWNE